MSTKKPDIFRAWQDTYHPINNILHSAARCGILFDAAAEDDEIPPNFLGSDTMLFKDNLKESGFYMVRNEEDLE